MRNRLTALLAERFFERLGFFIAPKWRMRQRPLALHLQDLFKQLQISCVFDVGGNIGEYGEFLRLHVDYQGTIISFEPTRAAFSVLERKAAIDGKWRVFNIGLGSENTSAQINVMANDRFSSLLDTSGFDDPVALDNVAIDRQTVTLRRLDDWMEEHADLLPPGSLYLKLDTQGYDLNVMRGCGDRLSQFAACQSEIPFQKLYAGVGEPWDALRDWHDAGFDVTGMFETNRDRWQRAVEFDCVMLNRAWVVG